MYAQLGDIKFEGLKGFDSLSLKSEQIIAEHQLIEGKPRLQNAGSKADELSISIKINSQFANPENEYSALNEYLKSASVLTLINGRGELLGEFVMKSLELTVNKTNAQGQWVDIDLAIDLIEDYNTDKQKQAELDAKAAGFANVDKMPTIASGIIPISTDAGTIMTDVNKAAADAKAAESLLDKARKYADSANGYMDQTTAKIEEVRSNISGIQEKINNSLTLGSSATSLLAQIPALQSAANNLLNSLSLHDIQTSLGLNSIFQGQISTMFINASPIAAIVATQI